MKGPIVVEVLYRVSVMLPDIVNGSEDEYATDAALRMIRDEVYPETPKASGIIRRYS